MDAPGMGGEVAVAQPLAPEVFGRVEPLQRLRGAARPTEVVVAPSHGAKARLVLAQLHRAAGGAARDRQLQVAGQMKPDPVIAAGGRFAELAAAPGRGLRY